MRRNYTLEENPGIGAEGLYYYLSTFARAMHAYSGPGDNDEIEITLPDGSHQTRDWANDLIDRLAELQNDDGSFRSVSDRWMESDPVLITSDALIALGHATK
jgi:squalene-hopene/tetraprenyl-beta-curcumene cyclase